MKKVIILLVLVCYVGLFTGCSYPKTNDYKNEQQNFSQSTQNKNDETSIDYLIGSWFCSRNNSVNDMSITLTFAKNDKDSLKFTRIMMDSKGNTSGGIISGTVDALYYNEQPTIKISYLTNGGYILIKDSILYECFSDGTRNAFKKI